MSDPAPTVRRRPPALRAGLALVVAGFEASLLALGMGGFATLLSRPPALGLVASWMVAGVVLAVLAPARGRPARVATGEGRGALLLLGLLPLALPALTAWAARSALWPLPGADAVAWTGVGLSAAGLALRVAAIGQLGARFSPVLALDAEHRLETSGLYARIRHPGYLGALLASLGAVLALGSAAGLILFLLFAVVLAGRVRREEAMMVERFGPAWELYRRGTGALLPRLGAARTPAGQRL